MKDLKSPAGKSAAPGKQGGLNAEIQSRIGHQLRAECEIIVSGDISAIKAHEVAVDAEHSLLHALPRLSAALVHADPKSGQGADPHAVLASHR